MFIFVKSCQCLPAAYEREHLNLFNNLKQFYFLEFGRISITWPNIDWFITKSFSVVFHSFRQFLSEFKFSFLARLCVMRLNVSNLREKINLCYWFEYGYSNTFGARFGVKPNQFRFQLSGLKRLIWSGLGDHFGSRNRDSVDWLQSDDQQIVVAPPMMFYFL